MTTKHQDAHVAAWKQHRSRLIAPMPKATAVLKANRSARGQLEDIRTARDIAAADTW